MASTTGAHTGQTLQRSPLHHPCLAPRRGLPNRLSLLVVTCASQRQATPDNWIISSEEFLSRDTSLTMAPWDAGRGGAGVKDDPRNSAWQCSEEKHCPRLVDVHTGQCVHKERWKTTQEGRETKATREKGIQAGMTALQQPQRPFPEQPQLASLQKPTAYGGACFQSPSWQDGKGLGDWNKSHTGQEWHGKGTVTRHQCSC